VQIDPFKVGDDVNMRVQTFDIEAVIFLSSLESVASTPCRTELRSAVRQGMPVFVIHLEGSVPTQLKERFYWHMPFADDPTFHKGLADLVKSITGRVAFAQRVRLLYPENSFHETSAIARTIATETDRTILAEFVSELTRRYLNLSEPTTRFWIALALGRANTPLSARLLDKLPRRDHPLVLEGIRQAMEMIQHDAPNADPQSMDAL
jgi:hypothetical protein